jgi:hypothetical protein
MIEKNKAAKCVNTARPLIKTRSRKDHGMTVEATISPTGDSASETETCPPVTA